MYIKPSDQDLKAMQTKPQDWIFTFGLDHRYANCFIRINGTISTSRATMQRLFGSKWAFQYPNEDAAGVKKWNLLELNINDLPHLRRRDSN